MLHRELMAVMVAMIATNILAVYGDCIYPAQIMEPGDYLGTVQCESGDFAMGSNGSAVGSDRFAYPPMRNNTIMLNNLWHGTTNAVHVVLGGNESYASTGVIEVGATTIRVSGCTEHLIFPKPIVAQILISDFMSQRRHQTYILDDGNECDVVIVGTGCAFAARLLYTGISKSCEKITKLWHNDSVVLVVIDGGLIVQDIANAVTYHPEWTGKVITATPDFPLVVGNVAALCLVEETNLARTLWHVEHNLVTGTQSSPISIPVEANAIDVVVATSGVVYLITDDGEIRRMDITGWSGRVDRYVYSEWQHLDAIVCGDGIAVMDRTYGDVMYFSTTSHHPDPTPLFQPVRGIVGAGLWCDNGALTRVMQTVATTITAARCYGAETDNIVSYHASMPHYGISPVCGVYDCWGSSVCTTVLTSVVDAGTTINVGNHTELNETINWNGTRDEPIVFVAAVATVVTIYADATTIRYVRCKNISLVIVGSVDIAHLDVVDGDITIQDGISAAVHNTSIQGGNLLFVDAGGILVDGVYAYLSSITFAGNTMGIATRITADELITDTSNGVVSSRVAYTTWVSNTENSIHNHTAIGIFENDTTAHNFIKVGQMYSVPMGWPVNYVYDANSSVDEWPCNADWFDPALFFNVDLHNTYNTAIDHCTTQLPHTVELYAGAFSPRMDDNWLVGWSWIDVLNCNLGHSYREIATGRCRRARVCATGTEYTVTDHTTTTNTVCRLKTKCGVKQYDANFDEHKHKHTIDRVCTSLTVCAENTMMSATPTSDRVCVDWLSLVDHPELGLKQSYQLMESNLTCRPPDLVHFVRGQPADCAASPGCTLNAQYHHRKHNKCYTQSACPTDSSSTISLRPCKVLEAPTRRRREVNVAVNTPAAVCNSVDNVIHGNYDCVRALLEVLPGYDFRSTMCGGTIAGFSPRPLQLPNTRFLQIGIDAAMPDAYYQEYSGIQVALEGWELTPNVCNRRHRRNATNGIVDIRSNCTDGSFWCRKPVTCASPEMYVLTPGTNTTDAVCGRCANNGRKNTSDHTGRTCVAGTAGDDGYATHYTLRWVSIYPVIPLVFLVTAIVIKLDKYKQ
jgi:hypothetical protein